MEEQPAAGGDGGQGSVDAASDLAAAREARSQRLLQILHLFEPAKVKKVDAILDAHTGEEEIYIAALVAKYQPKLEQLEPDPKTWKTGGANTYQMLPERDLGD